MANVNQVSPDGGTTLYDIEDTPIRSSIARTEDGTSPSATINADEEFYHLNVLYKATQDIATTDTITPNSNCEVSPSVTSQIAQKADKSSLGTASAKNSTSVVTDSEDVVESGAVYDVVGWGNKNLLAGMEYGTINQSTGENQTDPTQTTKRAINKIKVKRGSVVTISGFNEQSNKRIRLFYYSTDGYLRTITSNVFSTTYLSITIPSDTDFFRFQVANASLGINYQVEEGDTATAYEPYHASVDESKCDNSVIGTVEDGTNPTKSYAVGEHMTRGGKFCTVTSPVTTSSTWTLNGNYVEGDVASEFEKYIHGATLTITNLDDLPLGMGYANFTGNASPTPGYDFLSSFICFGTASDRIVMIYRIGNKSMYFNRYNAGAWSGWVVFTGTPI